MSLLHQMGASITERPSVPAFRAILQSVYKPIGEAWHSSPAFHSPSTVEHCRAISHRLHHRVRILRKRQ